MPIISKGHDSVKEYMEVQFLFSAHCLVTFYSCTKFCENILKGFNVIERTRFTYNMLILL